MDDLEEWFNSDTARDPRSTAACLPTAGAASLQQRVDYPLQRSAAHGAMQAGYVQQGSYEATLNGDKLVGNRHARGSASSAGPPAATAAASASMMQANHKQRAETSDRLEPAPAAAGTSGWHTKWRGPMQPPAALDGGQQLQHTAPNGEVHPSKRQHTQQQLHAPSPGLPATAATPCHDAAQLQQHQRHAGHMHCQQQVPVQRHNFLNDDWLEDPAVYQQPAGLFQRSTAPPVPPPAAADPALVQQQYPASQQQQPTTAARGAEQQQQQQELRVEEELDEEVDTALISADFDLSREEVVERIEQLVQQLVCGIAAGQLPELTCVSTAASNVVLAHRDAGQQDADAGFDDDEGQQRVLRLGSKVQKKTMLGSGGQQAYTIARVLQLLDVVHGLLRQGRTATQRDIYYTLLRLPFFNSQRDLTSTINTTLSLLRVPRSSLGITAASKGAVAGRLLLRSRPGEAWQDCSLTGSAGRSIPGEMAAIQAMSMRPAGARFILVVEKDAVFQRLVEDRLFDDLPSIIITGRGMPDLASRAFLAALVAAAGPGLPVLGLVDWNPAGVHILLSYKYGTAAMGLEAARYAVPSLCWLGINSDMLQDVPRSACQELTHRDLGLIPNLKSKLADTCPDWVAEIEEMEESGLKADIEALYGVLGHQGLAEELSRRIVAQQYLS